MIDSYMHWRIGVYDNIEQTDTLLNKYLDIFILNPRTHIKNGKALYTDYEVLLKTNHPEFALEETSVRRRYREFVWLKNRLGMNDVMMVTAPSLPGKRYIGRFKDPFLKQRQLGLQGFMNKVVEVNSFLLDPALHLFLQSELTISQMDNYLQQGMHLSNIRDRIIALHKTHEQKQESETNRDQKQIYNIKTVGITKSQSADSILSMEVKDERIKQDEGGRGWSQFIGDATAEPDVTDYNKDSDVVFSKSMVPTASVLPGGRLKVPSVHKEQENKEPKRHKKSSSWNGHSNDLIDMVLCGYDVIPNMTFEDIMSITESEVSSKDINITEDSTEVDISEYNIIDLPGDSGNESLEARGIEENSSVEITRSVEDTIYDYKHEKVSQMSNYQSLQDIEFSNGFTHSLSCSDHDE